MKTYELIIKKEKMLNQAEFMKRMYRLSVWINKRYNYNSIDCNFAYSFADKEKQLILIILTYN